MKCRVVTGCPIDGIGARATTQDVLPIATQANVAAYHDVVAATGAHDMVAAECIIDVGSRDAQNHVITICRSADAGRKIHRWRRSIARARQRESCPPTTATAKEAHVSASNLDGRLLDGRLNARSSVGDSSLCQRVQRAVDALLASELLLKVDDLGQPNRVGELAERGHVGHRIDGAAIDPNLAQCRLHCSCCSEQC